MSIWSGRRLAAAIFGQSHAAAIGVTLEGLPAGEAIDASALEAFMSRRAPGSARLGALATQRREADRPEILCGALEDPTHPGRLITCGAPLAAVIRNGDARSKDYAELADKPRPSHADWPAHVKYRGFEDVRGGGAFSGRLTAALCFAGGAALQLLKARGICVASHVRSIGAAEDRPFNPMGESSEVLDARLLRRVCALSNDAAERLAAEVEAARLAADSVGGVIETIVQGGADGLPVGLGGPLFDGLDGRLAQALFGIPGVKGVAFGDGFEAAKRRGSENNDPYVWDGGRAKPAANHAGGIAGGMTTGAPLLFTVAMKPTPSIGQPQRTVSLSGRCGAELIIRGRHDPSIVLRAVPVVEAVAALVVLDAVLAGTEA